MRFRVAVVALSAFALAACGGSHAAPDPAQPQPAATVTVTPATANLAPGASARFTATVTAAANTAVLWTATGGTIAGNGMFTAGLQAGTFAVTATSAADAHASAAAKVTIAAPAPPAVTVTVAPATATVQVGATEPFTAAVAGTQSSAVAWQATGGTIDATGLFTAGAQAGAATVTASSQADPQATATAHVTVTAAPPPPGNPSPPHLFTSPGAAWLYGPPTGQAIDISSQLIADDIGFSINTVDAFGYPVQYTDGTHGCTTFTDTLQYSYTDKICVPNPAGAVYLPTKGCCNGTSNDGHLVIVDTATLDYYDFWKLYTDAGGHPTSTNVGKIVTGNLATSDGTPGTTALHVTGLAGDIMPGELDCEDCLRHALNVVVPAAMNSPRLGRQGPAAGIASDGGVVGGVFGEGAKIRFDPSIDVDSLDASTAIKAIMKALQQYGGLVTDQTGANAICFYSDLTSSERPADLHGQNLIREHLLIYY